jgi:hypothetical protein
VSVVGLSPFAALVAADPHVAPVSAKSLLFGLFVLMGEVLPLLLGNRAQHSRSPARVLLVLDRRRTNRPRSGPAPQTRH